MGLVGRGDISVPGQRAKERTVTSPSGRPLSWKPRFRNGHSTELCAGSPAGPRQAHRTPATHARPHSTHPWGLGVPAASASRCQPCAPWGGFITIMTLTCKRDLSFLQPPCPEETGEHGDLMKRGHSVSFFSPERSSGAPVPAQSAVALKGFFRVNPVCPRAPPVAAGTVTGRMKEAT